MLSRSVKITLVGIAFLTMGLAQGPPVEPGPFRQPVFDATRRRQLFSDS